MNTVPWSAEKENLCKLAILIDWAFFWLFVFLLGCGVFLRIISVMILSLVVGGFWARMLLRDRARLQAMLLNKPQSTQTLTKWVRLMSPGRSKIRCTCGTLIDFIGAEWFPNHVDPGGGRFSVVCPCCGIGYYSLKSAVKN